MPTTINDPVCHMEVVATSFPAEYAGIRYAFCSAQCKERFLANPRLYIGLPGRKAPAQQGEKVIKRRRLALSTPLDAPQDERVRHALLEMMGIDEVCITGEKIEIQYDLIQVTAAQIADRLALVGAELGGGWTDRLKLAFIYYQEECEVGSLEVASEKHCH